MIDSVEGWEPENVEGAPTLVYEVWSWHHTPEGISWKFIGYRTLSLRQMLKYREFGYLVVRSKAGDRRDSTPLFPIVGSAQEYPPYRMDAVPMPEPGPPRG